MNLLVGELFDGLNILLDLFGTGIEIGCERSIC